VKKQPLPVRQAQRREAYHRQRITQAATAEEQHAAAYAWHLSVVRKLSPTERARELWERAQILADRAMALERRQADGSGE